MTSFFSWYLTLTFLGWLTFPLAYHLFPVLADRGYTLSRALGLLLWGYVFWLSASLGIAQNDSGGLLLGLAVLIGLSAWVFVNRKSEIIEWFKSNLRLIVTTEMLFLAAFALLAFFRSANPEILGTEKPMELLFINAIMRSPTFPPRDTWLSGYAISYYYFGYVMTAMLAKFTGVPGTMAFNLMIALVFGLSATGAYGILYNLLAMRSTSKVEGQSSEERNLSSFLFPLLAPLFLLLVSNIEGFLEVLRRRGIFWKFASDGSARSTFWPWLGIKEIGDAPVQPLGWIPDRFWWWWRASRVIQDYDLKQNPIEVIDEFPAFSYILGDLHPHVLAMPFTLLAIAVALNLFLGGWRGRLNLFFGELKISRMGFFFIAVVVGGLAFLNTWDILTAAALIVFAYALAQVHESGWGWGRAENVLMLGLPLGVTAFLLYLPFYAGFSSQAGGILPNIMNPTRGVQLWVMFATLFIPLFTYLIYLWLGEKRPADWLKATGIALGVVIVLLLSMLVIGFAVARFQPELVKAYLESQGVDFNGFLAAGMQRRLAYIGSLITLLALLIPSFAFLLKANQTKEDNASSPFILLLIALATLLILAPEFVYLRDQFSSRMNTVFKFYYQAWILLSIASAYGTAVLLQKLRGAPGWVFSIGLVLLLMIGLTYPALASFNKANNFKPSSGFTLNDFDRVQRENPDEAAAMTWLQSEPDGVVAEAIGGQYSAYGRIAIYTGLPTVLGWPGHESQWRGGSREQGSRQQDIETLYSSPDWVTTQKIIQEYNIRYVYIGGLERSTYRVNETKFQRFLKPVFQQGTVIIYEAP